MNATNWNFDHSYSRLPALFYELRSPTPVRAPDLVLLNEALATELGLSTEALHSHDSVLGLSGSKTPLGALPLAQAYAGHQYGHFTMLGDGRAILLGEHITPTGARFDIQLKGSGPTKYSRRGDGRAQLGPMLREYVISEAMHALGIPSTRSLAVVRTGEVVWRDTAGPGAILTRVAQSHLRVGTVQYAAEWGTKADLRTLADYIIARHFPQLVAEEERYLLLFREVVQRQATLVAKWQLVGFVHGVMNTDNMSLCGETIDYGPCAFMDTYDPATVFSSIDTQGRYAYGQQPKIAAWNLARLAEALLPLIHADQKQAVVLAQDELARFAALYDRAWASGMRRKLGLRGEHALDMPLFTDLLHLMQRYQADYTNFFLGLTFGDYGGIPIFSSAEFKEWLQRWQERREQQDEGGISAHELMRSANPALVPRNHRVEEALQAAEQGNLATVKLLLKALANPYAHSPEQKAYSQPSGLPYRTFCGT
ncbi:MAG: YdiU family protein [Firmicutes bacterium]|nr:YdiU family protein [Dethiobacter sp.]MBS3888494.1 YdiU family protein [Bacillota bacterium]